MLTPLLRLLAAHPGLALEHVSAYAELMQVEARAQLAHWQRRTAIAVVAGAALACGLALAGIALLLVAALPIVNMPAPWLLIAVPAGPLLVGAACAALLLRPGPRPDLQELSRQLDADLSLIRSASLS